MANEWHSSEPDAPSGAAFTLYKYQHTVTLTDKGNTSMLTKAELDHPSCPCCYRPTAVTRYCDPCVASGAALRHRTHPHRSFEATL